LDTITPMQWNFPYRAQRMPVLADQLVVASQPLAAQAGLGMLARGGNAVDAAIATAAALPVLEPVMNGLGGDAQVLLCQNGQVSALNGSGRAPAAWSPERFAGRERMPTEGWDSVTVPGGVAAWIALWRAHGSLPLATLFEPAIRYAREGFPVSPMIARQWERQSPRLLAQPGFAETFLRQGQPWQAGERFRLPAAADTLERIADTQGVDFYDGRTAQRLLAHAQAHGGAMTADDLRTHRAEWVVPNASRYRTLTVHELPPSTQGLAVQIALGVLEHLPLGPELPIVDRMHLQIEAMKIAFADCHAHVADPAHMRMPVAALLDPDYLRERSHAIRRDQAGLPQARALPAGGTVYFTTADRHGMLVSFIQSNFQGFGSGVVVPDVGVSLHNRGAGFSLQPDHPNQVQGGKRPFHTIIPGLLTRDGEAVAALGVVGADMQPQGQVQLICGLEDLQLNPQAALDAPRWRVTETGEVWLEEDCGEHTAQQLAARGHRVQLRAAGAEVHVAGQIAWRHREGQCWIGATDPRRDGSAVGF
jgi:gamma-glutamyltranspeptidase/glutathione hydrolase